MHDLTELNRAQSTQGIKTENNNNKQKEVASISRKSGFEFGVCCYK